jgi:hypothetical protein
MVVIGSGEEGLSDAEVGDEIPDFAARSITNEILYQLTTDCFAAEVVLIKHVQQLIEH